jgi:hypothetical protein
MFEMIYRGKQHYGRELATDEIPFETYDFESDNEVDEAYASDDEYEEQNDEDYEDERADGEDEEEFEDGADDGW